MAENDDDETGDDLNLALPSLRGRRKRKKEVHVSVAPAEPREEEEDEDDDEPTSVRDQAPEPTTRFEPPTAAEDVEAPGTAFEPAPYLADPEPEAATPAPPKRAKEKVAREPREKKPFRLPPVSGMTAAVITGAVIGLLAVGLTYGSLEGCEAVKGTSSCGRPGFMILLAIVLILVYLGGALLRAWAVPDPVSTSTLAVGLLVVVTLAFLIDVVFSIWMIGVVPAITIGTFALAHWVTTRFIEPAEH